MLFQQTVGKLLDSGYLCHPHIVHIFHFIGRIYLHLTAVLYKQKVAVVCDGIPVVELVAAIQALVFHAFQLEFYWKASTHHGVIV